MTPELIACRALFVDYIERYDEPYVRTWQGWLYLAVVMDLYSRERIRESGHRHGVSLAATAWGRITLSRPPHLSVRHVPLVARR